MPTRDRGRNALHSLLLHDESGAADAELLGRFLADRDEAAFAELVRRHGPMVLGVCQRVLRDPHAADDAFQATLLVLIRKASAVVPRERVGNWLHGVAYRTALKAKTTAAVRRVKERRASERPRPASEENTWDDWRPLLDRELNRLPEKYRAAVVLCDLEGKPRQEAARELGWPEGTLSGRLARARQLLARRLARHAPALTAAGLTVELSHRSASAQVPASLTVSVTKTAAGIPGLVAPATAALAEGVLNAMWLRKCKHLAALLLAVAVLVTGAGVVTHQALADRTAPPPRGEAPPRGGERQPVPPPDVTGSVVEVAKDGKEVTLEQPSRERGGKPTRVPVKFAEQTKILYFGVGPDGAKPTVGHQAQVRWQAGSKDTAAEVKFAGSRGRDGAPSLTGTVTALAEDGKRITLQPVASRGGEEPKPVEVKLADGAWVTFGGVGPGQAKPDLMMRVEVWLRGDSKDTATQVRFGGKDGPRGREANPEKPAVSGQVSAVSEDGKKVTVALRGESRELKLTDKTSAVYFEVCAGGAKPTVGYEVAAWGDAKAEDTAVKLHFRGNEQDPRQLSIGGKVVEIGKDGKTVTLEVPSRVRGEEAAKPVVKIADRTKVTYYGVGPDGAKPTAGYSARVQLRDDAKDTAEWIAFSAADGGRR